MRKLGGLVLAAAVLLHGSCGGAGPVDGAGACHQLEDQACDKAYGCVVAADRDTEFADLWGASLDVCKGALANTRCATAATGCPKTNDTTLTICKNKTNGFTCDEFFDPARPPPDECDMDKLCAAAAP